METTLENARKVTLSCRVLPKDKLAIAMKAKSLDMTLCQYTEAVLLCNHGELMEQNPDDKEVLPTPSLIDLLPPDLQNIYLQTMAILKKRYPDFTEEQLLVAALRHAMENHKAFVQRDMKTFLKRIDANHYDFLTPKTNKNDR
jgi:hypothetical protein